jgi:hypothetical protein
MTNQNECRCEKKSCGCAAPTACTCGPNCTCKKACNCGGNCSCAAAK